MIYLAALYFFFELKLCKPVSCIFIESADGYMLERMIFWGNIFFHESNAGLMSFFEAYSGEFIVNYCTCGFFWLKAVFLWNFESLVIT